MEIPGEAGGIEATGPRLPRPPLPMLPVERPSRHAPHGARIVTASAVTWLGAPAGDERMRVRAQATLHRLCDLYRVEGEDPAQLEVERDFQRMMR